MKVTTFLSTITVAAWLAGSPSAKALNLELGSATSLDTFEVDIIAYNNVAGVSSYAISPLYATFGGTTSVRYGTGATIDISSAETFSGQYTTDTITMAATGTNFYLIYQGYTLPGGAVANALQFNIGNPNAPGGGYKLDFDSAVPAGYTQSGNASYQGFANPPVTLNTVNTTFSNGNTALSAYRLFGYTDGTSDISQLKIKSITYSITYPTVPEPSTWAISGFGAFAGIMMLLRRRSAT